MKTPQQIAFIVSQLQLLIVQINEESESLEEDRMEILNSTGQRLVENMTTLHSSREDGTGTSVGICAADGGFTLGWPLNTGGFGRWPLMKSALEKF